MIAYNKEWLNNKEALCQIEDAFAENCIGQEEKVAAAAQYSIGFYTPDIFIRVGLVLLSIVIVTLSFGLLALLFFSSGNDSEETVTIMCIFFGIGCYAALEWFVKIKQHYQSGVDDVLVWMAPGFILTGLNFVNDIGLLGNAVLVLMMAAFLTLRFADRLMAIVAAVALLAVVLFSLVPHGNVAKNLLPFVLMIASALIYFSSKKIAAVPACKYYKQCLTLTKITGLVCFYLSGNYYVVREAGIEFFNLQPGANEGIPYGWIFWIFTLVIPLLYIFWGILKKDAILLRTGLLLVAAIVCTVRHYYYKMPVDTLMIIGGLLLTAIAYALIKYLKEPKAGFTSEVKTRGNATAHIETLVIAETLTGQPQSQTGTQFGGGSFGGAGASGQY